MTDCIERNYSCGEDFAMFSSENINGRLERGLWLGKKSWNLWRESHRSSETCYMKHIRRRSTDNPMIPDLSDLQAVTRINNWEWGGEETEPDFVVLCRDKTYRLNNSVTLFWWIFLSHQTTTAEVEKLLQVLLLRGKSWPWWKWWETKIKTTQAFPIRLLI